MGFKTAIDDFGAGFAGLGLLSKFQPDIVKLDMALIRDIDTDRVKRTIVRNTLTMLRDLDISPVCEGVETVGEYEALSDLGVSLMQGYLLAKPAVEALPRIAWVDPVDSVARRA
ncbi:MAG: EAL domain-containing protein, partial [Brevundimonas sp.]